MFFNYSKKNIILLSLIISFVMFVYVNSLIVGYTEHTQLVNKEIHSAMQELEDTVEEAIPDIWSLRIPKIDLEANISEGTTPEVLENFIGHFEETSKWDGNIGLAAHNRGYQNNYFERLEELQNGDEIIYTYKGNERKFKVISKEYIKNTDWSNLVRCNINKLTLITCVKNQPEYRVCVQAIEC